LLIQPNSGRLGALERLTQIGDQVLFTSMPVESRISPSVIPAASRTSRGIMVWVVEAAWLTRL